MRKFLTPREDRDCISFVKGKICRSKFLHQVFSCFFLCFLNDIFLCGMKKKIIFYQKRGAQTCPKDVRTKCASVESAIHTSTRLQPLLNLHNLPQTPHHFKILEIKEGLVHHLKFFPFFFSILFAENVGIAQWFRYLTLTHLQQVSIPRLIHPLHVQNHLPYMCR